MYYRIILFTVLIKVETLILLKFRAYANKKKIYEIIRKHKVIRKKWLHISLCTFKKNSEIKFKVSSCAAHFLEFYLILNLLLFISCLSSFLLSFFFTSFLFHFFPRF